MKTGFLITTPSPRFPCGAKKSINKLNEPLGLRIQKVFELHTKEVEKRGT